MHWTMHKRCLLNWRNEKQNICTTKFIYTCIKWQCTESQNESKTERWRVQHFVSTTQRKRKLFCLSLLFILTFVLISFLFVRILSSSLRSEFILHRYVLVYPLKHSVSRILRMIVNGAIKFNSVGKIKTVLRSKFTKYIWKRQQQKEAEWKNERTRKKQTARESNNLFELIISICKEC